MTEWFHRLPFRKLHVMRRPQSAEEILKAIVIAIDGPSASGKTTTARGVAARLGLRHVDTGAMYRAVTLHILREGVDVDDGESVVRAAEGVRIDFGEKAEDAQRVFLNGGDVTEEIRAPEVTRTVSRVSAYPDVRRSMVRRQRSLADSGGVVLEGRDIGTVVLPGADVKVYLDASIDTRAERRLAELRSRGISADSGRVRDDLNERDRRDSTREVSPLRVPIGASILDTSPLTIEDQICRVVSLAREVADGAFERSCDRREARRLRRRDWRLAIPQDLIRAMVHLVWGIRIIRKSPYEPNENCIYASNHRSNADPPFVGSTIRRNLFFLAKESLFRVPMFGRIIRFVHAFPIRRGAFDRVALNHCLDLLAAGESVLMFPEGGRMKSQRLGRARAGIGYLAIKSRRPVVPMYVDGTLRLWSALWRRPRLTVIHGRPIRATDPDLSRYDTPDGYREYGAMVMRAIEALQDEHERRIGVRGA